MNLEKIKRNMLKGKPARMFPVLPEGKKEERATSILLAVFSVVPDLAREILSAAGCPIGKRSQIDCYTEVSFKGSSPKSRPDGLIIVTTGGKHWTALVESKVGRNEQTSEQVEEYLDIAKEQSFDAVITISNQFAALPTHYPVKVNRAKVRNVGLFHFSWLGIVSRSILLLDSKTVNDIEQAIILRELVRFLEDESSGVSGDVRMSASWRGVCDTVHQGSVLKRTDPSVSEAVADWHQLVRYLSIRLSVALSESCSIWLSRKHQNDPSVRLQDDMGVLVSSNELIAEIEIPNAASRISVTVSLLRKTLDLRINCETPKDVKQQRAAINFVLGQFKNSPVDDLIVRVNWPRRVASTELPLQRALDEDERRNLIPENFKDLPSSIDLIRVVDLGGKLKTSSGLPLIAESEITRFYQEALQGLKKWVPEAPKVRKTKSSNNKEDDDRPSSSIFSLIEIDSQASGSFAPRIYW